MMLNYNYNQRARFERKTPPDLNNQKKKQHVFLVQLHFLLPPTVVSATKKSEKRFHPKTPWHSKSWFRHQPPTLRCLSLFSHGRLVDWAGWQPGRLGQGVEGLQTPTKKYVPPRSCSIFMKNLPNWCPSFCGLSQVVAYFGPQNIGFETCFLSDFRWRHHQYQLVE